MTFALEDEIILKLLAIGPKPLISIFKAFEHLSSIYA